MWLEKEVETSLARFGAFGYSAGTQFSIGTRFGSPIVFLRLALTFAVLFGAAAFTDAAVVQVEFTAELESSSSGFDPVTSVSGYFRFDDSAVYVVTDPLYGKFSYSELLELGIESPIGPVIANSGLVMGYGKDRFDFWPNNPEPPIPYYELRVGDVVYSESTSTQDGGAVHFYPYVFNSEISLLLNLEKHDALFDGTNGPPVLSQSLVSMVRFNNEGQTASYLITSLQIVPEPTSLLLLSIASVFWVMSRRRV